MRLLACLGAFVAAVAQSHIHNKCPLAIEGRFIDDRLTVSTWRCRRRVNVRRGRCIVLCQYLFDTGGCSQYAGANRLDELSPR